jgi:hypothetical protein
MEDIQWKVNILKRILFGEIDDNVNSWSTLNGIRLELMVFYYLI